MKWQPTRKVDYNCLTILCEQRLWKIDLFIKCFISNTFLQSSAIISSNVNYWVQNMLHLSKTWIYDTIHFFVWASVKNIVLDIGKHLRSRAVCFLQIVRHTVHSTIPSGCEDKSLLKTTFSIWGVGCQRSRPNAKTVFWIPDIGCWKARQTLQCILVATKIRCNLEAMPHVWQVEENKILVKRKQCQC